MGLENFEEFYKTLKKELQDEGLEINEKVLKSYALNLDHHGKTLGKEHYNLLAESFVFGIYYKKKINQL